MRFMEPIRSNDQFRNQIVQTITFISTFAIAFRSGAALSVINQPQKPPSPSGKFKKIGVRIAQFQSGFRGKIFYPAAYNDDSTSKEIEAAYCTDYRETSDGMAALVGFKQLGLSFLLAHLATAGSGAIKDATPLKDTPLPMLVYSHGFGGNMDMATYFLREIASHGIVVVAVEHTDGTASGKYCLYIKCSYVYICIYIHMYMVNTVYI
jgi:hypothetical protein